VKDGKKKSKEGTDGKNGKGKKGGKKGNPLSVALTVKDDVVEVCVT